MTIDDSTATGSRGGLGEAAAGAVAILPAAIGVVPFGLLLGALAAEKGLTPLEVLTMSATVFAGGSKFVALDMWRTPAPWLALGFSALLVNLRHVVMGASIRRCLGGFPPALRILALLLLADEIWAMAEKRAREARLTPAWYFGLAGSFYANWLLWTWLGAVLGASLGDPARFGFDFAFTAIFIGLLAGFRRAPTFLPVIAASAAAAVVAGRMVSPAVAIACGAAAGVAAAAVLAKPGAASAEDAALIEREDAA